LRRVAAREDRDISMGNAQEKETWDGKTKTVSFYEKFK
jgi:hypothetical protein